MQTESLSEEIAKITKICNWVESRWLLMAILGSIVISAIVCVLFGAYQVQGAVQITNDQTADEVLRGLHLTNFARFVGLSAGLSIAASIVLRLIQKLLRIPFLVVLAVWAILFGYVLVFNTLAFTDLVK